MARKRKHRPVELHFNFGVARNYRVSTAVHACPLQSKDLGRLAKTGCFHPDLFNTPRFCREAVLSLLVQARPALSFAARRKEPPAGLPQTADAHPTEPTAVRLSLRPAKRVGEATARPRLEQILQGENA